MCEWVRMLAVRDWQPGGGEAWRTRRWRHWAEGPRTIRTGTRTSLVACKQATVCLFHALQSSSSLKSLVDRAAPQVTQVIWSFSSSQSRIVLFLLALLTFLWFFLRCFVWSSLCSSAQPSFHPLIVWCHFPFTTLPVSCIASLIYLGSLKTKSSKVECEITVRICP